MNEFEVCFDSKPMIVVVKSSRNNNDDNDGVWEYDRNEKRRRKSRVRMFTDHTNNNRDIHVHFDDSPMIFVSSYFNVHNLLANNNTWEHTSPGLKYHP
jgi:hypothetical protein